MRCKRHPCDPSSSVGVCASCLRERLFTLIAAQARQQAEPQVQAEDCRKSDAQHPPPLIFPRSASPFRSNNDHQQFDQRLSKTPQVDPTSTTTGAADKKKHGIFSLLASIFGFRSEEPEAADATDPKASRVSRSILPTSSSSRTWLSGLLPNRRKKQSRLFSLEDPAPFEPSRQPCHREDRGLSPVRATDGEDYEDSSGAYSSESSPYRLKQGLQTTPTRARKRGQPSRNVSGLAVCFSPLVRASPTRQHRNVGGSLVR